MTILDLILATTRATVALRRHEIPLARLESFPEYTRPRLPFANRLREKPVAFIAETKRRSPSKGTLRDPYYPVEIARLYSQSGAAAISVLTEQDHFDGSLDHLHAIREVLPDTPLLRKDFIVDEYQLTEARAWGADAVLLIAAALDPVHLRELQVAAHTLGLGVLLEVHDGRELDSVDLDMAEVVGVNNRDLHTFEVDVTRAPAILHHIPQHIVRVAESGLQDAATIAQLAREGIHAVLIGETFMRAADPGEALSRLRADTLALLSTDA